MVRRLFFNLLYLFSNPPWDTGVTPPEVYQFLEETPPGRALDLGCGTGTNAINLARNGWQVTGVDFVPKAIRVARRKARRAEVTEMVDFQVGNVLELDHLEGPFDLILDIGCFHGFSRDEIHRYVESAHDLAAFQATLLIYAHLKTDPDSEHGLAEEDIQVIAEQFHLVDREDGLEGENQPSTWLRFEKGAAQV